MKYIKYPRTYHVPWSEGATNDDKINKDMSSFYGKNVVITEKMDGENIVMPVVLIVLIIYLVIG
jgi:hypothetical protein